MSLDSLEITALIMLGVTIGFFVFALMTAAHEPTRRSPNRQEAYGFDETTVSGENRPLRSVYTHFYEKD